MEIDRNPGGMQKNCEKTRISRKASEKKLKISGNPDGSTKLISSTLGVQFFF